MTSGEKKLWKKETEEEARLDNSDVPDEEIRYKKITTYPKKVELL